jgi:hypothetical protein
LVVAEVAVVVLLVVAQAQEVMLKVHKQFSKDNLLQLP